MDASGYEKRFIVPADEILTAFLELERAIHKFAVSLTLREEGQVELLAETPNGLSASASLANGDRECQ